MRGCARKGTGDRGSGGLLKSQFDKLKSLPPGSPPPPLKMPTSSNERKELVLQRTGARLRWGLVRETDEALRFFHDTPPFL